MHHEELLNALSTGWIETTLGVSRAAVADWRRGKFPIRRRVQLAEAVLALVEDTEKTPPPWAEALKADLIEELKKNRQLIEALARPEIWRTAERVIARLEALGPPADEAPDETDGEEDQGAAAPPGPGPGSRRGRVVG